METRARVPERQRGPFRRAVRRAAKPWGRQDDVGRVLPRVATGATAVACLWALAGACASPSCDEGQSQVGTGGTTTITPSSTSTPWPTSSTSSSGSTSSAIDGGSGGCVVHGEPEMVPEGWTHDPDWSCNCWFYMPEDAASLPEPIAWEPCPVAPPGLVCQAMVSDWSSHWAPVALDPVVDHNPDGSAVLAFRRIMDESEPRRWIDIVADVDG